MSCKNPSLIFKNIYPFNLSFSKVLQLLLILSLTILLVLSSCSPAKRFPEKEEKPVNVETESKVTETPSTGESLVTTEFSAIRVSMQGIIASDVILLNSPVILFDNKKKLASLEAGSYVNCYFRSGQVGIVTDEGEFSSSKFILTSSENDGFIKLNGKRIRGEIQISVSAGSIDIINVLNLEDYIKGVLPKEMPIGKGNENFEALKALAICVRTYAVQKIKDGKIYFDIYADTRDQVYGGADAEHSISNNAVEETKNLILKYNEETTTIYYHSTCGGYTESSQNVFTRTDIPYLRSVKDGSDPNCIISPRFEWEENYSRESIINRLKDYHLLDINNYKLDDLTVISRFSSGRVHELEIEVADDNDEKKIIVLLGNEIRNVLRTANKKSILWSTMFDVSMNSDEVTISGRGFGHGVGLCQWGAISLSRNGTSYTEILELYYPGTVAGMLND